MLADQFLEAAAGARNSTALDETARLLWRAHAEGLCVGLGYVTFAVCAPKLAGEFVQGGSRAGAVRGFEELIGEHRSPFRRPAERDGLRQKIARALKRGLASNQLVEEDRGCET